MFMSELWCDLKRYTCLRWADFAPEILYVIIICHIYILFCTCLPNTILYILVLGWTQFMDFWVFKKFLDAFLAWFFGDSSF